MSRRRTHRPTSAGATPHLLPSLAEVAEPPGEGEDDITPESIVAHLLMIVGSICDAQVLGLVEQVITLDGKGELLLEEGFGELGAKHEFILLRSGVAVVPIVVQLRRKGKIVRNGPVHREGHLIVPAGILGGLDRVPALGDSGFASEVKLHKIVGILEGESLRDIEIVYDIGGKGIVEIQFRG